MPAVEAAAIDGAKKCAPALVAEKREAGLHLLGIVSAKDVIRAFPPDVNPFAVEGTGQRSNAKNSPAKSCAPIC